MRLILACAATGIAVAAALVGAAAPAAADTYVNTLFTNEGFVDDVVDTLHLAL